MLPRRVGGTELSLMARLPRLTADPHDQFAKESGPPPPPPPLGKLEGGGGVAGLEPGRCCDADWKEYEENESRMRCSSGIARPGEGGQAEEGGPGGGGPDGGYGGFPCQPWALISADV